MKHILKPMWLKKLTIAFLAVALTHVPSRAQSEEVDIKEKIPVWRKAAQEGDKDAQYNMGLCYLVGNGLGRDQGKAVACFRIAASGGHAGAQFKLGNCYEFGWGIAENEAEAKRYYDMAAKQGYVEPTDYLTAEDVKLEWLADLPVPRTLEKDYPKITAKNAAFTAEVRAGKHDLKAELEAALHNKSKALRIGDKERINYYQILIAKLTPVNAEITTGSTLSKADVNALISAYEMAGFQRSLYVSYKHEKGWTVPVSKKVSFLSDELGSDFAGCALFPSADNSIVVVNLNISSQLDYLCAFVPDKTERGEELIGTPKREWLLTAQWPAPIEIHNDLRVGELGAIKEDDRAGAAEIKMMLGDKEGCLRHMRILKRDYLRMNDRLSATKVDVLFYQQ